MAKLPTSLLPRSLPSSASPLLTAGARPIAPIQPRRAAAATTQQVRHATEVVRPKRPFTWTQIVQLSDGSTYTTRSTSPLPVYRSTKDTRNHLTWQPSEASLQNVEVDEAGKLASFRQRFGSGYELAGGAEVKAAEVAKDESGAAKKGKKARAAEAARAERAASKAAKKAEPEVVDEAPVVSEEDSFASLMRAYVRDQPNLKGGQVAGKVASKKGKKK